MINCEICKKELNSINNSHLNTHSLTVVEYKNLYPNSITVPEEIRNKLIEKMRGNKNPMYGKKHTEETKRKMRESHDDISGDKHPMYGKKHSEETKRKIAEHSRGRKHTYETKNKMREINLGKKLTEETKRKIRESCIGRKCSYETKLKISKSLIGDKNPFFGKTHTEESKLKMRKHMINKYLDKNKFTPSFNEEGCKKIDEYGKQNGYNFQHAINGGERRFIGYFVDGYDEEKNVVVEYYEKSHLKPSKKIRDEKRKNNLINHLKCKFIEILYNGKILITENKEINE